MRLVQISKVSIFPQLLPLSAVNKLQSAREVKTILDFHAYFLVAAIATTKWMRVVQVVNQLSNHYEQHKLRRQSSDNGYVIQQMM